MKEEIIKLRREGLKYKEICEKLGCSKSTVSYHCSKENLGEEVKEKRKKLEEWNISIELENKVLKLREDGEFYKDIYKILKKEDETITKYKINLICRKNGLSNSYKKVNKPTDEEIEKMQEYYDECLSLRKVGKKFNKDRFSISKYLRKRTLTKGETEEKILENKKLRVKNVINWRKRTKQKLVDYKGGGCQICKYNKCIKALDFHHKDPNEKDFGISGRSWSFERLKKEVDKCILVCNRCHTEIHDGLINIPQ